MFRKLIFPLVACGLAAATESFENLTMGPFTRGQTEYGTMSALYGQAEILREHARSGAQALRMAGGENRQVIIELDKPLQHAARCTFWLQRWTHRAPFRFTFTAITEKEEKELVREENMQVGGYHRKMDTTLPAGTLAVLLTCSSPPKSGALVDDFSIHSGQMSIEGVDFVSPRRYPILKRAEMCGEGLERVKRG